MAVLGGETLVLGPVSLHHMVISLFADRRAQDPSPPCSFELSGYWQAGLLPDSEERLPCQRPHVGRLWTPWHFCLGAHPDPLPPVSVGSFLPSPLTLPKKSQPENRTRTPSGPFLCSSCPSFTAATTIPNVTCQ